MVAKLPAGHYLVHRTLETELSDPVAKYVGTPVRDEFLETRSKRTFDGPVVVSMGHLTPEDLSQVLQGSKLQFLVFGSPRPRREKNIEYRPFDDEAYLRALQAAPFAIVSANSSAIDVLAVGKPLLYTPTPGMFEQRFCGRVFEYLKVAEFHESLTSEIIDSFSTRAKELLPFVEKLDIFDNDAILADLENEIQFLRGLP